MAAVMHKNEQSQFIPPSYYTASRPILRVMTRERKGKKGEGSIHKGQYKDSGKTEL